MAKSRRSKNGRVQRLYRLQKSLKRLHRSGKTWRQIAADYPGVNHATLCAIAKGREPKKASIRHALGLPTYVPAPTCVTCGEVHISKRCPLRRKPGKRRNYRQIGIKLLGLLHGGMES